MQKISLKKAKFNFLRSDIEWCEKPNDNVDK